MWILFLWLALFGCTKLDGSHLSFPSLSLYGLEGDMQLVPSGKKELLFISCNHNASQTLLCWYHIFREGKEKMPLIHMTVIPVLPSLMAKNFLRYSILALIKQKVPKRFFSHVGVLFSNPEDIASLVRLTTHELEELQIFFLNEQGKIVWRTSGEPTQQSWTQLKQYLYSS